MTCPYLGMPENPHPLPWLSAGTTGTDTEEESKHFLNITACGLLGIGLARSHVFAVTTCYILKQPKGVRGHIKKAAKGQKCLTRGGGCSLHTLNYLNKHINAEVDTSFWLRRVIANGGDPPNWWVAPPHPPPMSPSFVLPPAHWPIWPIFGGIYCTLAENRQGKQLYLLEEYSSPIQFVLGLY